MSKLHPLDEAFGMLDQATALIEQLESVLIKCNTEIEMWRQYMTGASTFLYCIGENEKEFDHLREKIINAPLGIADIKDFAYTELKCYRDTQEKIK